MKKLIFIYLLLVSTFVFAACTSQQKEPIRTKIQNSKIDPLLDPRDNNASLVYPNYRTGYEPNYLNAEGIVMNYSDSNHTNWSWLGLLGLVGLSGLVNKSTKRT